MMYIHGKECKTSSKLTKEKSQSPEQTFLWELLQICLCKDTHGDITAFTRKDVVNTILYATLYVLAPYPACFPLHRDEDTFPWELTYMFYVLCKDCVLVFVRGPKWNFPMGLPDTSELPAQGRKPGGDTSSLTPRRTATGTTSAHWRRTPEGRNSRPRA